jgi:hypothetical protein
MSYRTRSADRIINSFQDFYSENPYYFLIGIPLMFLLLMLIPPMLFKLEKMHKNNPFIQRISWLVSLIIILVLVACLIIGPLFMIAYFKVLYNVATH